jgi:transcriptional regulator with XRE-family HTH domain
MPNMPRKPATGDLPSVRLAFGRAIRELRRDSGIAQERLAFEADVDRGYMSGLERGLHSPTLDTIMKLLWKLDVSFMYFSVVFERELKRGKRTRSAKS